MSASSEDAVPGLVAAALAGHGWGGVDPSSIEVELKSGCSASKVFKVSAQGHEPPAVALHTRVCAMESPAELCMSDAAQLFSKHGLGPPRLAVGEDWFIEPWAGSVPAFGSVDDFCEVGRLLAKVHALPTGWFDAHRTRFTDRQPELMKLPEESMLWSWLCYPSPEFRHGPLPAHLRSLLHDEFYAPRSAAGRRLVTVHGDFHAGNMLRSEDGRLSCIDFEMTCVSNAACDVGRVFMWRTTTPETKRAFVQAYLEASGLPCGSADVQALYVDAEAWQHPDFWRPGHSDGWERRRSWSKSVLEVLYGDAEVQAELFAGTSRSQLEATSTKLREAKRLDAAFDDAAYATLPPLSATLPASDLWVADPSAEPLVEELNVQARQLSLAFWARLGADAETQVVLSIGLGPYDDTAGRFYVGIRDGRVVVRLHGSASDPRGGDVLFFEATVGDETWRHVCVVLDADVQQVQLFVDGAAAEILDYSLLRALRLTTVCIPGKFERIPDRPQPCPTPGCPFMQNCSVGAYGGPETTCCRPCKASKGGNHGGLCARKLHQEPVHWSPEIGFAPGLLRNVQLVTRPLEAAEVSSLAQATPA